MTYLLLKSLHIVSMVAWFAALFYLVRLFVYHTEAQQKDTNERDILINQYHTMETRLLKIICRPAMILTWIFGIALMSNNGGDWLKEAKWLHIKIMVVFVLTAYSEYNGAIIRKLNKGKKIMSSEAFRLYNEVPTLFLLFIVLLAIFKNMLNIGYTLAGILIFGVVLLIFMKIYKKIRLKS